MDKRTRLNALTLECACELVVDSPSAAGTNAPR